MWTGLTGEDGETQQEEVRVSCFRRDEGLGCTPGLGCGDVGRGCPFTPCAVRHPRGALTQVGWDEPRARGTGTSRFCVT